MMFGQRKIFSPFVFSFLILFLLYTIILSHKINLVNADLGRHIQNGQYFFLDKTVLNQNFYSYTYPTFSTINHHWAVGVLFFLVYRLFGFIGLHLLFILVSLVTFLIFLLVRKKNNYFLLIPLALFSLPLLAQRTEIRPEIFSNLFAGIIFFLLFLYREEKINYRYLFLIPLIEIFWVNIHIYFFLGPVIVGSFLLESFLRRNKNSLYLLILFFVISLATLLNPLGLTGSLAPLNEFKNYGYELAENQSVWYMVKFFPKPVYLVFKTVFGLLCFSFFLVLILKPKKISLAHLLLAIFLSYMAWTMTRNITLFSLFSLPLIIYNFETIKQRLSEGINLYVNNKLLNIKLPRCRSYLPLLILSLFFLVYYFSTNQFSRFPYWYEFGLGLEAGNNASAIFFINNHLRGPIYNNYDDGGYLIFHLFPQEKVYIDNRPEAYPASFFTKEYVPSQDNENKWLEINDIYHFNTIFFSYHDATPWGQQFIKNRLNDPRWALVFIDKDIVILLKRNPENQPVINGFGIEAKKSQRSLGGRGQSVHKDLSS